MSNARARYAKTNVAITAASPLVFTPNDGAAGGEYIFDAVCASDVTLQAMAADGVTARTVAAISAPGGTAVSAIKVGQGAVLRVAVAADAACSFSLGQVN